ncbi:MAG: hypothetical protein Q4P25_04225 [Tissierellia bacterium]|nr:hypothetical protein [Tissierellia bacterium]
MIAIGAISRGLSLTEIKSMTLGEVVDFCITHNRIHQGEQQAQDETTVIANQSHFDSF